MSDKIISKHSIKKTVLSTALLVTSFDGPYMDSQTSYEILHDCFNLLERYSIQHHLTNDAKNNIIKALWVYPRVVLTSDVDTYKTALTYALKAVNISPQYVWKRLHKALNANDDEKQDEIISTTKAKVLSK